MNSHFSPYFISLCPSLCLSQCVAFREIYPGGSTADSPAAGNKGYLATPQSQRLTGKPCGPAPRQSDADRNPWPPDKTGWHQQLHLSPFGWSHAAVWLTASWGQQTTQSDEQQNKFPEFLHTVLAVYFNFRWRSPRLAAVRGSSLMDPGSACDTTSRKCV